MERGCATPRDGRPHQVPIQAIFQLPHGSVVTYRLDTSSWAPEWILVDHELDLLPYRALITTLAHAEHSVSSLLAAAGAAGGQVVYRPSSPRPRPDRTCLPPPLTPPARPPFGSLSAYLRHTPEARQAIRVALAQPLPHPPDAPLVCPPLGADPGLVGTAFDYALRFVVQGLHPEVLPTRGPLVARYAAFQMNRDQVLAAVDEAEHTLGEVVDGLPFGERHARAAVVLASYEVVARTGLFQGLAGFVPAEAWRDVLALVRAVPLEAFRAEQQLILNPHFPAAGRFGGADADLLVDDILIEVKATRHLRLRGEYLQQLSAYLVLDRLAGIRGSDLPVRRLGVYYARHGVLHVLPVRDAFRPGLLPQLVTWFDESLPRARPGK
ncbi:hypothetical protein V3W47_08620 [Deinococcus sp. YIM 134068]|uniref:hypothetical protein n=1 Tax=Deinococcus lichenicola TaxID=3118910 RepID=UPI002F947C86